MFKKINEMEYYLGLCIYTVLIIGFINYLNEQRESHKDNFNIIKFLFGVLECNEN